MHVEAQEPHAPRHNLSQGMDQPASPVSPNPSTDPLRGYNLPPIQTTFVNKPTQRLQRPRPVESVLHGQHPERVPLQPQSVKRQQSKGSLRTLFTRTKSTKTANNGAVLSAVEESQEAAESPRIGGQPLSPTSIYTATRTITPAPTLATPPATPRTRQKSSPKAIRTKSLKKDKPFRPITAWDPPPLFQAYPQAVKHGSLHALTLSAHSILRINGHRRNSSVREDPVNSNLEEDITDVTDSDRRRKEENEKHSRKVSGSFSRAEWTQKIYVLVTSGYLLQYAGDGNFDRLPEKMMQLGKDSVAFASDVIPGKHWVLQISQTSNDEGVVAMDSPKNLFSRLGFRTADSRRATRSFLLVLDSPEEMDSWLVTVRREIESLGGKKFRPETSQNDPAQQLQNKPSRRYLVKRDPNQLSNPAPSAEAARNRAAIFSYAESDNADNYYSVDSRSVKSSNRRSVARPSTEAISVSTVATTATDLERREEPRLSYLSSGTRTIPSSHGSSPATSPVKASFVLPDLPPFDPSIATGTTFSNLTVGTGSKRMSMQAFSPPIDSARKALDARPSTRSPRPNSILGSSSVRSVSPATPNFSVPSFSKRYSLNSSNPPPLTTPSLTASTVRPSPSPSPPNVTESPPKADRRPLSTLGDLPSETTHLQLQGARSRAKSSREFASPSPTPRTEEPLCYLSSPRHSFRSRLTSSKSDVTPHPKRLSSLEYSRGISPARHPPPTSALPPLPRPGPQHHRPSSAQSNHTVRTTDSSASTTQRKLRRPVSMQVRSAPLLVSKQPVRSPSLISSSPYYSYPTTIKQQYQPTRVSFSNSTMISAASSGRLAPHKSMPDLSLGPPAAPPPNCPLPEVPPIIISQFPTSFRGSSGGERASMATRKSIDERRLSFTKVRLGTGRTPSVQGLRGVESRGMDIVGAV